MRFFQSSPAVPASSTRGCGGERAFTRSAPAAVVPCRRAESIPRTSCMSRTSELAAIRARMSSRSWVRRGLFTNPCSFRANQSFRADHVQLSERCRSLPGPMPAGRSARGTVGVDQIHPLVLPLVVAGIGAAMQAAIPPMPAGHDGSFQPCWRRQADRHPALRGSPCREQAPDRQSARNGAPVEFSVETSSSICFPSRDMAAIRTG